VNRRWLALSAGGFIVVLGVAMVARGSSEPATNESGGLTGREASARDHRPRNLQARREELAQAARLPSTITFWNEARGLAGTGETAARKSPGRILLTEDGGHTFRVVLRTKSAVSWVDTAGTTDAWAVIKPRRSHTNKQVLQSGDGGRTWHRLPDTDIVTPSFAGPSKGLALRSGGPIVASFNGGRSWHRSPDPCPRGWFGDVTLATEFQAWALCAAEGTAGLSEKSIFSSADGGKTWERVAYADYHRPPVGRLPLVGYPTGISFSPDGLGFVWGDRTSLVSRDGGNTWESGGSGGADLSSAAMLTAETGFILDLPNGSDGPRRLRVTHDGGTTWSVVHRW
jgi:photosystem II stability/assembly factor-like uncharacterized protein